MRCLRPSLRATAGCGAANEAPQPTAERRCDASGRFDRRAHLSRHALLRVLRHPHDGHQRSAGCGRSRGGEQVPTTNGSLPGPFAGQAMNCRSCHFVTEFQGVAGAGNRSYSDFTSRSPIPAGDAGLRPHAAQLQPDGGLVHRAIRPAISPPDGEFTSGMDLVKGTMTARNFGWLPSEYQQAVAHIARVIREDNGCRPACSRSHEWAFLLHTLSRHRLAHHGRPATARFRAASM